MRKTITLLCAMFCMAVFAKAETLLNEQFNSTSWESYTASGNHEITTSAGTYILSACSVEPTSNLTGSGATSIGRVSLTAKDSSIELPELSNCGIITINANSGSVSKNFSVQKKLDDGSWQTIFTFTTESETVATEAGGSVVPVKDYSYDVKSEGAVTLRIINATSGAVRLYEISVASYVKDDDNDDDYTSAEILNEQFNAASWENYTASGDYGITASTGTYALTACSVEATNNLTGSGATSIGRVTLTAKDSSIELPEFSSCGSITINANSGSVSKNFSVQKKLGDGSWQTIFTFTTESETVTTEAGGSVVPVKNYSCDVKSEDAVTLRIINATSGAVRLYEIWVTDYVKKGSSIATTDAETGEVASVSYFNLNGLELKSQPSGICIEKTVYENGAVETKKIFK